jgi:hypothetical protein
MVSVLQKCLEIDDVRLPPFWCVRYAFVYSNNESQLLVSVYSLVRGGNKMPEDPKLSKQSDSYNTAGKNSRRQ